MINYLYMTNVLLFMNIEEIVFLGIFTISGFALIYFAIKIFKRIQLVRNSDEVSVNEAVNRDDIVQINGKARKFKEVLDSPLENKECFAYDYKVEKKRRRRRRNKSRRRSRWKTIDSGEDAVDFIIEDNSGTAYIHTNGAETSLDNETQYSMSNSSDVPTTVAENNTLSFDLMGFSFGQKLRMKEGTIQPGEDVFVIGKYNNKNTKNDETVEIDVDETVYISDKDTKQEIMSLLGKFIIFGLVGVMFILFSVSTILSEIGLL